MRKLNKEQINRLEDLADKLEAADKAVLDAVNQFNEKRAELFEAVTKALEARNGVATNANDFFEEIRNDQTDYFESKSERWQESDAASSYSDWMDQFADIDLESIEIEEPEELEYNPDITADELRELGTEP